MGAVGLALFMSALDGTIVALALPRLADHYAVSNSGIGLVVLAYAVPLTALVLPAGSWVHRVRPLPLFLLGALGFGAGSLACALAPNLPLLLAGRVVQGSFAALLSTQGFAIAAGIVRPQERGTAIGVVGALAPLGAVVGPGVGGLLLATFGVSSVFLVNVPVCLAAAGLGLLGLRAFDLGPRPAGGLRGALGSLLRTPAFLGGLLAFVGSVGAATALYYVLPFGLFGPQHLAPASAGLVLLVVPVGMAAGGPVGGLLRDRYGGTRFVLLGAAIMLAASLALVPLLVGTTGEALLVGSLLAFGLGSGLFAAANNAGLMSVGSRATMGAAGALVNLGARLGSIVGPLAVSLGWALSPRSGGAALGPGLWETAAFAGVAVVFAGLAVRPRRDATAVEAPGPAGELRSPGGDP